MDRQAGCVLLLLAVVLAYVLLTPYTKVEESFNVQAIHDLLYHRLDLLRYDHMQFPGVVPRTFLGASCIAAISSPVVAALHLAGLPKVWSLCVVRGTLGCMSVASLAALQRATSRRFGPLTGACLLLLTALQFHLPFYMSRPLPNVMAVALTNLALADWVGGGHPRRVVVLLTVTTAVFRCDVLLLLGLVSLHLLASRQLPPVGGVATGLAAAAASIAASVGYDSWLWGRWLWPEGEVLWFNTVLNKSGEWGVMPWAWYFTSALPRSLHAAYLLAPLGAVLDRRARPLFVVALLFVVLYSNLGHKEVRFLFPVLPLWNVCAAVAVQRIVLGRSKSAPRRLLFLAVCAMLAAGAAVTALSAAASAWNYPGGVALACVHALAAAQHGGSGGGSGNCTQSVHIGVVAAMTGVSRFGEKGPPWYYSKEEGLSMEELGSRGYTYLLTDAPHVEGYTALDHIEGFAGLHVPTHSLRGAMELVVKGRSPISVATIPQVHLLKRHSAVHSDCLQ